MGVRILIVSDAWKPQVNGVVRTLESVSKELMQMGHEVQIIGPDDRRLFTFPMPFYPEIKLEFFARPRLKKRFRDYSPDILHIATEGPLGWAARGLCLCEGRVFTTAYHTNFPDYLSKRVPRLFASTVSFMAYAILRRFHAPSEAVLVATASIENELRKRKFSRLVHCPYGVDIDLFKPYGKKLDAYKNLRRPILLSVGRIATEKNLRAFLDLNTQGSRVVIGEGPELEILKQAYPQAHFLGFLGGEKLARAYAGADVFVFPSKTDTFGLVLLEACAAGLRCAAYPVTGPRDIFSDERSKAFAALDENLQKAVDCALLMPDNPEIPRAFAANFSWKESARKFLSANTDQRKMKE